MKHHTETQKNMILADLMTGASITGLDGLKYGCLNVRNRISELGREGFKIDRELIKVKTKFGVKHVMKYYMKP